jgi:hypothetical protein
MVDRRERERQRLAYHEAGHVVACYLLSHGKPRIVYTTINRKLASLGDSRAPEYMGRAHGMMRWLASPAVSSESKAMVIYAGAVAQSIRAGRKTRLVGLGEGDMHLVFEFLKAAPRHEEGAPLERTWALLREPAAWAAVEVVAAFLLREDTLYGEQAAALVRQSMAGEVPSLEGVPIHPARMSPSEVVQWNMVIGPLWVVEDVFSKLRCTGGER